MANFYHHGRVAREQDTVVAGLRGHFSVLGNRVNVAVSLGEGVVFKTTLRSPRVPPFVGLFAGLCARFRGQFVLFVREKEHFCMVDEPLFEHRSPRTR